MAQTYNSGFQFVQDGDTTVHSTTNVEENINILSAQIQWRGNDRTETTTSSETEWTINSTDFSQIDQEETVSIPLTEPSGSGWNHKESEIRWTLPESDENSSVTPDPAIDVQYYEVYDDDGTLVEQFTYDPGEKNMNLISDTGITFENIWIFRPDNNEDGWSSTTRLNQGAYALSNVAAANHGISRYNFEAVTRWQRSTSSTTTYQTQDPSVGGDVSASYSGTLNDGVDSPWITLNGLSEGSNTFNHSIGGSNEAFFQFEYTYEKAVPTPVYTVRVHVGGTTYDLPLVDPSDSALQYGSLKAEVENQILAADLVDTSNADASPLRVHTPQHGTLAWRKDTT